MEEESGPIVAMISKEGEEMPLIRPVKTSGNVEAWLNKVQDEMKDTLIKKLSLGNKDIVGSTGKAATAEDAGANRKTPIGCFCPTRSERRK